MRAMMRAQVVLPQPDSPTSARALPGRKRSETPRSACTSPNERVMDRSPMTGSPGVGVRARSGSGVHATTPRDEPPGQRGIACHSRLV